MLSQLLSRSDLHWAKYGDVWVVHRSVEVGYGLCGIAAENELGRGLSRAPCSQNTLQPIAPRLWKRHFPLVEVFVC